MKAGGAMMILNGKERLRLNIEDMARADTLFPFIFLLSQSETEKILIGELSSKGIKVERNTKLLSFVDNKKHVDTVIRKGKAEVEHIRTQFLCGCDGSHSAVRNQLKLEFKGDSYPFEFVMADTKVEWNRPYEKVQIFLESGKVGIFFPLKSRELSRVICISRYKDSEESPKTETTTAFKANLSDIQNMMKEVSHEDLRLSQPEWVTRYHVHHRCVDRLRVNNVFLVVDAAHIHSPMGGQGMNTGLQDANNLAWKIKYALLNPEMRNSLLETYQLERHPVAVKLLHFTDRLFSAVIGENKAWLTLRNMTVPVLTKMLMTSSVGKRLMFKFVSQLNIRHHDNFVVKEKPQVKILDAGFRAPNARLDARRTIHDLMTGYNFHLLAFKKDGFNDIDVEVVKKQASALNINEITFFRLSDAHDGFSISVNKQIFDLYGILHEGLFLIRPDNYVEFSSMRLSEEINFPHFRPLQELGVEQFLKAS
jgi:2-polyprenyl-6-methoxyphenol hydroxylase-like FAD-dependent oxidoreductase